MLAASPYIHSPAEERYGQFSPDGQWMAYTSDVSGNTEVYVAHFPDAVESFKISSNGGSQPRWRRDDRELYYLSPDSKLMAVEIRLGKAAQNLQPHALFDVAVSRLQGTLGMDYAVAANGGRFLVNSPGTPQLPLRALLS